MHILTSIRFTDTLHSFIRVSAIGNCRAMTIRIMLKSEMQVNTVCAFKISPVITYAINVTKLITTEELKKNDMKAPWIKFNFRNHLSSSLLVERKRNNNIKKSCGHCVPLVSLLLKLETVWSQVTVKQCIELVYKLSPLEASLQLIKIANTTAMTKFPSRYNHQTDNIIH